MSPPTRVHWDDLPEVKRDPSHVAEHRQVRPEDYATRPIPRTPARPAHPTRRGGVSAGTVGASAAIGLMLAGVVISTIATHHSDDEPEPPAKPPKPTKPPPRSTTRPPALYTVQKDDNPHRIAAKLLGPDFATQRPAWWEELQRANLGRRLVRSDRWASLQTGDSINIPEEWRQ